MVQRRARIVVCPARLMGHLTRRTLLAIVALSLSGEALTAQIRPVVVGRVADASTRVPLVGARVIAMDSTAVFTDSLGNFAIPIPPDAPIELVVAQFGYHTDLFELGTDAPGRISVLLLDPAPIELEGITVIDDTAIERVFRELERRRNIYPGAVAAYDAERLRSLASTGTAWDFVRVRAPGLFQCSLGRSGLCVRGRSPTLANPDPQVPVVVCIDGWATWAAASELATLDMRIVSLIEIFSRGRGGIRVYTGRYLASVATIGDISTPFGLAC